MRNKFFFSLLMCWIAQIAFAQNSQWTKINASTPLYVDNGYGYSSSSNYAELYSMPYQGHKKYKVRFSQLWYPQFPEDYMINPLPTPWVPKGSCTGQSNPSSFNAYVMINGDRYYINVADPYIGNYNSSSSTYSSTSSSSSLIGHWVEYRADDPSDTYLLSHYEFLSTGYGSFSLTDGNTIREKRQYRWKQSGTSIYITMTNGDQMTLSYNNGLLVETSGFGQIVYRKKN